MRELHKWHSRQLVFNERAYIMMSLSIVVQKERKTHRIRRDILRGVHASDLFQQFKLLPFFVSFLTPDTEGSCDRHRVIARSRCFSLWRLVRSPSGRWSLKVLRFFDFETFDFRKTKKDIWRIRWHAPAVILQSNFSLLPLWCCDNSIIEVGLCLFRWFRRIFENCSYTHWAMTDLDRRIFESGHIPTEL